MKQFFLIFVLLSGAFTGHSQFWKTKISGNGQVMTQERTLDQFDKLTVTGPFKVEIIKSPTQKITVTADENLMNIIDTYVKSGKLVIRINPDFSLKKYTTLKITLPTSYLSKIVLTGSGLIYNQTPFDWHNLKLTLTGSGEMDFITQVDHIDVTITGSGAVKLQGKANQLEVTITGSGELLAKGLIATDAKITLTGSGEAYIQSKKHLNVKLFGSGDLYYFGEPQFLKTKIFGSGEIHLRAL